METRPSLTVVKSKTISTKKVSRKLRTFLKTQENDRLTLATQEGNTVDFNSCLPSSTLANLQILIESLDKTKKTHSSQSNIDLNNDVHRTSGAELEIYEETIIPSKEKKKRRKVA